MRVLEAFAFGLYWGLVITILTCLVISTLVWTWRVCVLGHFPKDRPWWLKRPLKEVILGYPRNHKAGFGGL